MDENPYQSPQAKGMEENHRGNPWVNSLVVFFAVLVPILVGLWLGYLAFRSIAWG